MKAMSILRARVYELEKNKLDSARAADRSQQVGFPFFYLIALLLLLSLSLTMNCVLCQIGSASRSDKIRTYNFHQDRVTDHRIGYTSHNLEMIMEGEVDELIDKLDIGSRLEVLKAKAGVK